MGNYSKSQVRQARYAAAKMCSQCGRPPVPGGKCCQRCRDYHKKYREKLRKQGVCKCKRAVAKAGSLCELCRKNVRENNHRLRDEVFAAYGGYECKCCGEVQHEFLQLDHINNDGAAHRRLVGGSGTQVYHWLKKHNFPPIMQVLCANCNYAKAHYGYCPHHPDKEVNGAPRKIKRSSNSAA